MAGLRLENIVKVYGAVEIVHDISCSIENGEFIVIVGPSGCGKSTLLRMIAGLEPVSSGKIFIDGRDQTHTPAAQRGIAMVFQSYALYPHMTVGDNMRFGLKNLKHSKEDIKTRVDEAARLLQMESLLDRLPSQLSGGQRQRVAIGRAIVREPRIFLFDEPLSNLDAELRVQMRRELGKLHQRLGSTMVYVTHDQVEAMTLADRIILLDKGRIAQFGTPLEIYNEPKNTFVARFIGSPKINLIEARVNSVQGNEVDLESSLGHKVTLPLHRFGSTPAAGRFTLGMRPEHLRMQAQPGDLAIDLSVSMIESLGESSCIYGALADGSEFVLKQQGQESIEGGVRITAHVAPGNVLLFDDKGCLTTP